MFKKIHKKINDLQSYLYNRMNALCSTNNEIMKEIRLIKSRTLDMPQIINMKNTIESQQRTIEALTNALQDKYEKGLFVYSQDYKITKVIRNGKELTHPYVRSLHIDWAYNCAPEIIIDEIVGTFPDEE